MKDKLYEIIKCLKQAKSCSDIDLIREEIVEIMPVVQMMFGYDQQNAAHQYDLWEHSVHTVLNLPENIEDDMLYLAALLHDIGKPDCQCSGKRADDTNKHYYGHPHRSMEIVRDVVLPFLEQKEIFLSAPEKNRLLYYVEHHDDYVSLEKDCLERHLERVTLREFRNLLLLEIADAKAHVMIPVVEKRIRVCGQLLLELKCARS